MTVLDKALSVFGLVRKSKAQSDIRKAINETIEKQGFARPGHEIASFARIGRKYGYKVVYFFEDVDKACEHARDMIENIIPYGSPYDNETAYKNICYNLKHINDRELGK